MGKAFLKNTADLLQKKHKRKQWQKIMISLSLVVALLTSCLLIHPAITMSHQATCGQEEHTHTEKCYEKKLICNKEEQSISESSETEGEESVEAHTHSDACYENVLICGKQEHTHSEACYPKEEEKKEEVAANTEEEDVKSEDQEDKAEEKTEDTEKAEARTLKVDQADYTVEVDCPAEANIPKDAKLKVREIKKDSDEYQDYYEKAMKAVASGDETDISFARFFDISFEVDGKEIEPEANVEVKITYDDKVEVPEKGKVKSVHFGNKTEVLDVKTNEKNGKMDEVKFNADSFSVYAILGTEVLTGGVMTADGDSYSVTVKYDKYAEIPDDAVLVATEVQNSSRLYQSYMSEAEDALTSDSDAEISFARFFDVSIMADGEKIQPATPAEVIIDYNESQEITEGTEVSTLQFGDSVPATVDAAVSGTDTQVDGVSFQAEEVSVYGIVGAETITGDIITAAGHTYTVTVTYDVDAKIPNGSQLKLGELAEGSEGYQQALDEIISEAEREYAEVMESDVEAEPFDAQAYKESLGLDVLDISIVDIDGNKVEPSAPVKVTIERKTLPADIDAEAFKNIAEIQHLNESTGAPFLETVATAGSETEGDITVTDGAVKAEFETGSFSLYTVRWSTSSITVHFVDRDGNELTGITDSNGNLVDGSSITLSTSGSGDSIDLSAYKKDGYTYANTRLGGSGDAGQIIYPNIRTNYKSKQGWRLQYTTDSTNEATSYNGTFSNGNNVYVIMDPVPSSGGSGSGSGSDTPIADLPDPETSKTLTDNHDGTYNLNLSITGKSDSKQENKNINILFIIDNSSSMSEGAGTGRSRLVETKEAVVDAAKELLKNNTAAAPKLVELAAIDFDRDENDVISWTSSESEFTAAINGITAGRGTNWEDGLLGALNYGTGDGDPTYVIFFTDGMPYGYRGNNNDYKSSSNLPAMMASKDEARAIVNSGRTLYNIFAYGSTSDYNADYLGQLTDYAYNDSSERSTYYKSAASSEDVVKALAEIVDSITQKAGFEKVKITDGITGLTQSTVIHGQAGAFTYYRSGGKNEDGTEKYDSTANEGKGEEWTDAPPASYSAATGVTWDLASIGQLEDGVTYTVSFTVWPDQDAYDTVAEINNTADPKAAYDALDPTVKAQILFDEETGSCSLKTNTEAKAEFTTVKTSTEKKLPSGATPDGDTWKYTDPSGNVWTYVQNTDGTYTGTTTKDKSLTYDDVPSISLDKTTMKVRKVWVDGLTSGEDRPESINFTIYEDGVEYKTVTLTGDGDIWEAEINIAPGIYVTPGTHGTAATGDTSGILEGSEGHVYTILETSAENHYDFSTTPVKPMLNGTTSTEGDMIEYLTKTTWSSSEAALTATNTVKDGIYIYKKVTTDGTDEIDCDKQFTFKITLKDAEGNPVYTSGQGVSGDLGWRIDKEDASRPDGYAEVQRDYYTSTDGTVTLTMDASGRIRIVNVPVGTTFTVEEVTAEETMPAGYEYYSSQVNSEAATTDNKATGTTVGNKQWSTTITNKRTALTVGLLKVDNADNTKTLEGAEFSLFNADGKTPATDAEGKALGKIASGPDGKVTIGTLLKGNYVLQETKAPNGYDLMSSNVLITVGANGVTAIQGTTPCSIEESEDGLTFTITVTNSAGVELPHTGGPGTLLYTLGGLMLILASALMYGFRMRRGERRIR